jgi:cob(I)alamin adenosyltransferase
MMKIYTKTGDGGETGLVDGSRVRKDHARVAAFGDVDELNAAIGVARTLADEALSQLLDGAQRDLFAIGAQVADPRAQVASRKEKAALGAERIVLLERAIDARETQMPPLTAFILPGGTPLAASLHVARTVCRRAERSILVLGRTESVDPLILVYLNRLSDLLFVLARHANHTAGRPEPKW